MGVIIYSFNLSISPKMPYDAWVWCCYVTEVYAYDFVIKRGVICARPVCVCVYIYIHLYLGYEYMVQCEGQIIEKRNTKNLNRQMGNVFTWIVSSQNRKFKCLLRILLMFN